MRGSLGRKEDRQWNQAIDGIDCSRGGRPIALRSTATRATRISGALLCDGDRRSQRVPVAA